MAEDQLILVGRVYRAHGLRGEVKVIPETDDPNRLRNLKQVYIGKSVQAARSYEVRSVRSQTSSHGITLVMTLERVDDRDQAESLRGQSVYASASDLPALEEDEYYIQDLIGLEAVSTEGEVIGSVEDVLEMPAHLTLVIKSREAAEIMIPAVSEFIDRLDLEKGRVYIRLIEGLVD